ncbi:MAG: C13 family peptidase [Candidatus Bathyarchaeota archaeon]|nr:C13 family peptidase [Candidatus Bathyarchaeota archaeon]
MKKSKTVIVAVAFIFMVVLSGFIVTTVFATPVAAYAKSKGASDGVIDALKPLDSDRKMSDLEQTFVDTLLNFEENHQKTIVNALLTDGILSNSDYEQMLFLDALPTQEFLDIIDSGNTASTNVDEDSWSNRFEQLTGSSYNVKNNLYAIVMTMAGHEYKPVDEMFKMLDSMGVPNSNVYDLSQEKNNAVDFEAATTEISHKANSKDKVIVLINSDGGIGRFQFANSKEIVTYKWFDEKIGKINADRIAIVIDACYSGSAIKDLAGGNRIILTACAADETGAFGSSYEFLKAFSNALADKDENGYVSIGEAAEYAKNLLQVEYETPSGEATGEHRQLSDLNNIGATSYFAEIKVGK